MRRVLLALWVVALLGLVAGSVVVFLSGRDVSNQADATKKRALEIDAAANKVIADRKELARQAAAAEFVTKHTEAKKGRFIELFDAARDAGLAFRDRVNDTVDTQHQRTHDLNAAVDIANNGNPSKSKDTLRGTSATDSAKAQSDIAAQEKALAKFNAAIVRVAKAIP